MSSSAAAREYLPPARGPQPLTPSPRHVAKTDEIKDFVVIEEGSIAKGIRRIVAVTGTEAHEVSRIATEFSKRLDWIETLEGKDKETALKQYLTVSATCASAVAELMVFASMRA